ncbi:unnamed protein product [Phytomonas sp. EM1]|nr:unnamed protein product [Phytomonas sp. EM1]|eukprot:CCW59820.1 unnamed protein product [Phytomonas sp. isolate EM1]
MHASLQAARRGLHIIPTEPLTSRGSPFASSVYTSEITGEAASTVRYPVKDSERGLFDRGVSPAAKEFIAEAEREYWASSEYLHEAPSRGAGIPETETRVNAKTGAVETITRVASPFGETYVPSSKERYALRGKVGELSYQHAHPRRALADEHAEWNLRKERQLEEFLVTSPLPMLPKAREVALFLISDFYEAGLALQPRNAEAVMMLFSRASLQLRLRGEEIEEAMAKPSFLPHASAPSSSDSASDSLPSVKGSWGGEDMNGIPFLAEMRRLYAHQKSCFVAPTPGMAEQLMSALSAVFAANPAVFHLAGRILIDCDKYVVLPTRSTYAAFFNICRVNRAMPFAIARMADAVLRLNVSVDAAMATAMLRGLNEGGYVEEAVALLGRIERVPLTTPLLNAALETLLLSSQALSCFSAFTAVTAARLRPDADTYTLLLLACEKSGEWARATTILADMQTRRIKGNAQTLNLLLKGLLMEKLHSYAVQLHQTMRAKRVEVWPALEAAVQRLRRAPKGRTGTRQGGKIEVCDENSLVTVNDSPHPKRV